MEQSEKDLTPERGVDLYRQLDREIDERIGVDLGLSALIAAKASAMTDEQVDGFRSRYAAIKTFQQQTLSLFRASLRGDADPTIADSVLGDVPEYLGHDYHRRLSDEQHQTPVFFRTDDIPPGRLSEIQCSGSGWGLAEQLWKLYRSNEDIFGPANHFRKSLSEAYSDSLRGYLGTAPVVHHLADNASRPHGVRYFIQCARVQGVRYFSYDLDVSPDDCNFVRSHDFVSLAHNNFHTSRMERCNRGELRFDLPPSILFDCKVTMAWPFWEKTRDHYTDEVRKLFPYTAVIDPEGVVLDQEEYAPLSDFIERPQSRRAYYIKYAGSDVAMNWGSKSVFRASSHSRPALTKLLDRVVADRKRGRYWILQKAVTSKDEVTYLDRAGVCNVAVVNSKNSGFYGPGGLMAILTFQENKHKVHGGSNTVLSLVS